MQLKFCITKIQFLKNKLLFSKFEKKSLNFQLEITKYTQKECLIESKKIICLKDFL